MNKISDTIKHTMKNVAICYAQNIHFTARLALKKPN